MILWLGCLTTDLWRDTLVPWTGEQFAWLTAPPCLHQRITLSPCEGESWSPPGPCIAPGAASYCWASPGPGRRTGGQSGLGHPAFPLCKGWENILPTAWTWLLEVSPHCHLLPAGKLTFFREHMWWAGERAGFELLLLLSASPFNSLPQKKSYHFCFMFLISLFECFTHCTFPFHQGSVKSHYSYLEIIEGEER